MKTLYQLLFDWKMGRLRRKKEADEAGQWKIEAHRSQMGVHVCSFWKDDRKRMVVTHVKWWAYIWAPPHQHFLMEVKKKCGNYYQYETCKKDLPPTSLRKTLKYCESMLRMEGEEGS